MSTVITLSQGKRIRHAREAAGLEQYDLADALRVGRSTISNWERDVNTKPVPYAFLVLIAHVTRFPVEFFEPEIMAFATIPDGGAPLDGVAATNPVTHWYGPTPQVTALRLAA